MLGGARGRVHRDVQQRRRHADRVRGAPTKVPKTIDAPKPATKSCAISACEKPYAA